jgi:DNA-binding IclR family transcriptional regulator
VAIVPAAAQALAILRHLSQQAAPVPAAAIARDLRLPRSTTYHLLQTMVAEGFAVHLADEQRFGLGIGAYELSTGYARQAPLQRLARVPLATLVDRCGQNAHLAVLSGSEVIYIIEERAPGRPPLVTDVGVRLPAHLTATGRALLAALPRQQVRALYPSATALLRRTDAGPSTPAELRQILATARRVGFATEHGEVTPLLASVAVTVRDHTGYPVAAVAITYSQPGAPSSESAAAELGYARQARRTADMLTRRISGQ